MPVSHAEYRAFSTTLQSQVFRNTGILRVISTLFADHSVNASSELLFPRWITDDSEAQICSTCSESSIFYVKRRCFWGHGQWHSFACVQNVLFPTQNNGDSVVRPRCILTRWWIPLHFLAISSMEMSGFPSTFSQNPAEDMSTFRFLARMPMFSSTFSVVYFTIFSWFQHMSPNSAFFPAQTRGPRLRFPVIFHCETCSHGYESSVIAADSGAWKIFWIANRCFR